MTLGWPPSLQQYFLVGDSGQPNNEAYQAEMSVGPSMVRLRDRVQYGTHTGEIICNAAESATFLAFWNDEHMHGAEPFEWRDPLTDETKMFRIVSTPQRSGLGGGLQKWSFMVQEIPS